MSHSGTGTLQAVDELNFIGMDAFQVSLFDVGLPVTSFAVGE